MNWKVGDIAILVRFPGDKMTGGSNRYVGEQVTLVSPIFFIDQHLWHWRIELSDGFLVNACERHLKPIPPPEEKGSWEDCIWKPQEILLGVNDEYN